MQDAKVAKIIGADLYIYRMPCRPQARFWGGFLLKENVWQEKMAKETLSTQFFSFEDIFLFETKSLL